MHPKFEERFRRFRQRLDRSKVPAKLVFIIMGILATAWFLVRVIPKPSRAAYPCMRAAFPIMTTFILWLSSFTGAFIAFKSVGRLFRNSRYLAGTAVFVFGLGMSVLFINNYTPESSAAVKGAAESVYHPSNQPMGSGVGIHPGRVVWTWDPDATDETCTNEPGDWYIDDSNTDQAIVDQLIDDAITGLAGEATTAAAWDAIFSDFNERKGKGAVGYSTGETIFIKINEGTSSWYGDNWSDPFRVASKSPISETSPQVTLSILKHLIDIAGVPQENIWVADPKSHIWQSTYEKLAAVYPDVNYGDREQTWEGTRTMLTEATEPSVTFSDKGAVMSAAVEDRYYQEMVDADYLVNLAALKAHARAGITLCAKNHFGSHTRESAAHMHPGLVAPENDQVERPDYGMYRVLVDIMGSSVLGQNTLLFLVDGLWGGTEATEYPEKWTMAPFNTDWPNSIFVSQDQVALESVCFDFLRHEAEVGSDLWYDRPNFAQGVDDYLHQAADPANWPEGIEYDPDNSGTPIGSLGAHEHWNNPTLKQYSRNMGDDSGIELYAIPSELVSPAGFEAREAAELPSFDGIGDDACWETVDWYPIDQLWIPWGPNNIPMDDFSGKFKIMWSSETDLMYFLVKTTDDVFVDGYQYPDQGYPDFDIVEVFIDEDHSGGPHIFDDENGDGENAFSYHIAINQPSDGGTVSSANVLDIAGTHWGDRITPDYFGHFPDLTVRRDGNDYYWEFSMQVHNDTYNPADPSASLVELTEGKVMGLSMAYCDNDTPGTERDNFFGSVEVEEEANNDHWMLADDYGVLSLVAAGPAINHSPEITGELPDYEFPIKNAEQTILSDLSLFFDDEDGDALTFQAGSDEPLVQMSVDGNTLKGTALSGFNGTATVTVTSYDPDLYNVSQQISITVDSKEPYILNTIDDYRIEDLGTTETVVNDLYTVFADDDGDDLTFTAESDNGELSVSISGTQLKVISTNDFVSTATVTVTASDGLYDESLTFVVSSGVGIALKQMEASLLLYPNPVTGDMLTVSFDSESSEGVFARVLGMNGQIFKSVYFNASGQNFRGIIPVNDLPGGIYILEIHHQGAIVTRKFMR